MPGTRYNQVQKISFCIVINHSYIKIITQKVLLTEQVAYFYINNPDIP